MVNCAKSGGSTILSKNKERIGRPTVEPLVLTAGDGTRARVQFRNRRQRLLALHAVAEVARDDAAHGSLILLHGGLLGEGSSSAVVLRGHHDLTECRRSGAAHERSGSRAELEDAAEKFVLFELAADAREPGER